MRYTDVWMALIFTCAVCLAALGTDHSGDLVLPGRQVRRIANTTYRIPGAILLYDAAELALDNATLVFEVADPNLWGDTAGIGLHDQATLTLRDTAIRVELPGGYKPRL